MTALRWALLLRQLGHHVRILEEDDDAPCDVLIALHARKSYPSIARNHEQRPERPLIVALTGTDLYEDIKVDVQAQQSLEWATRLIVLQRMGVEELSEHLRDKARVIYQSVHPPQPLPQPRDDVFEVCVVGHLREVKDPFRTAEASRLLPSTSKIQILHIGSALSKDMEQRALQESKENPRYEWLGELSWEQSLKTMARCRLLVLTSRMEGGANVVCEAVACSVPVLSSRISGTIGILGEDYPGFFPFGDTQSLTELLTRAETDSQFYQELKSSCEMARPLVDPAEERARWESLLNEFTVRDDE